MNNAANILATTTAIIAIVVAVYTSNENSFLKERVDILEQAAITNAEQDLKTQKILLEVITYLAEKEADKKYD